MILKNLLYILLAYLSGSVLYAKLFGKILCKKDITEDAKDKNPGTANAFMKGGFACGVLTLLFDLAKGFLPVFIYMNTLYSPENEFFGAFVLCTPVIGHIFPVFARFNGGKGITTTFGCLLGLVPDWTFSVILALVFIFFSLFLKISPHYYRTIFTYIVSLPIIMIFSDRCGLILGFMIIVLAVMIRMYLSEEEKGNFKVGLLWMH